MATCLRIRMNCTVCDAYGRWAKTLLDAAWFRNGGTCSSELGWKLSGYDRVIVAVAMRRARLWSSDADGWHRRIWAHASEHNYGWAEHSRRMWTDCGIRDWPAWATAGSTLGQYGQYVKALLQERHAVVWRRRVARHSCTPPYLVLCDAPGGVPHFVKSLGLPVATEIQVRHWCRLRCGLVLLMHLGGRASGAIYQDCIFCGQCTRKPTIHCRSLCPSWPAQRLLLSEAFAMEPGDSHQKFAVKCLSTDLCYGSFIIMAAWAADIDNGACRFWAES